MKDAAKALLAYIVSATKEDASEEEGRLTTYFHVIYYLLASYATEDVIVHAKS